MGDEHWYKEAIIYELHVKCFYDSSGDGIGDFAGLTQKLDYLQDLGVTAIWLLPFYPSPLKDDGYDIADYTDVHPHYGSLKDFKHFLKEAHRRGLRVITELVINHTSDQHPWFERARNASKKSSYHNYYVWSDTPDKYQEARIIFQDFESSNWAWDPIAQSYYWHRFYSHQPDLNFENPEVHKALFRILDYWMKMGIDGLRLDAIPYLYEKEGTICENLPETHAFLKKLRAHVDAKFSEKLLLAEANQWPEDAAKYFGEGDECHMAFHFPVMPRLFMAIHLEDSLPIMEIMGQTPAIPESCQWALFLRNHDELTLEMVTDEERDYMFRVYAYDTKARLNLGIRRRLAPLLKNDRRKIELMKTLLFSLIGTPVIYYGDEIGMGDNIYLGDRNGVRTPMQWSPDRNAGFSKANPQQLYLPPIIDPEYHYETINVEAQSNNPNSILQWTKQLIALRKKYKALSYGTTEFLVTGNRRILVFFREYKDELLMIISNLSRFSQYVELNLSKYQGYSLVEMFSGQHFPKIGDLPYFLTLSPFGYYWFSLEKATEEARLEELDREKEKQVAQLILHGEPSRLFQSQFHRGLESLLRKYLLKRLWFKCYVPVLDKIRLSECLNLTKNIYLIILDVWLTTGLVKKVSLFLSYYEGENIGSRLQETAENVVAKIGFSNHKNGSGILYDSTLEKGVSDCLFEIIEQNKKLRFGETEILGSSLPRAYQPPPLLQLGSERNDIYRKDKTVIYPLEQGALRLFWLQEMGVNLDVEMRLFLTQQTPFRSFLHLRGYIEYRPSKDQIMVIAEEIGSIQKEFNSKSLAIQAADNFFISQASSGGVISEDSLLPKKTWLECTQMEVPEEIGSNLGSYLEIARCLGLMTAQFHQALSSQPLDPEFAPLPYTTFYQRSLYQNIRRKITEGMNHLNQGSASEDASQILNAKDRLLSLLSNLTTHKFDVMRIRCHGNYTLENLHYTGQEFLIANFEGNLNVNFTERRYKRCVLLDLTAMLFSITEASFQAAESMKTRGMVKEEKIDLISKWAIGWSIWIGSAFLRSYLNAMAPTHLLPENLKEVDLLLFIFLLERGMEKIQEGKNGESLKLLLHWLPLYETAKLL